jgi:uncharacterized membrane protein YraQ (UPF0718 family)
VETNVENFILQFTSILYEALPFILLGAVIAGLLEELVPQSFVARVIPRSRVLAIAIGGLLGIVFPMCECGIIPVMRRLLRKGVPLSTCVCYMLAGPIINVIVMLSTYVAFSVSPDAARDTSGQLIPQLGPLEMAGLRAGFGFLVAFGTSLIVEWQFKKHGYDLLLPIARPKQASGDDGDNNDETPKSAWQRINNISETAVHDFVDITVFLILGALLAAGSRQIFSNDYIVDQSLQRPGLTILIMMALAILLCLCSEADAFVAASFTGLPPAAKLAFLVLGPMMDFKLYMMYTRIFRPRLIWTIILSVVVQVYVYMSLLHLVLNHFLGSPANGPNP